MNLVEDFDLLNVTSQYDAYERPEVGLLDGDYDDIPDVPTTSGASMLSLESTIRQASRGRGQVVAAAVASEQLLLATSKGYLLRYYWDESGSEKVTEIEVCKAAGSSIEQIFADPAGNHVLLVIKINNAYETHYLHRRWPKARALPKLRGIRVTAVGWQRQLAGSDGELLTDTAAGGYGSFLGMSAASDVSEREYLEVCTGDILLGTDSGTLHELHLDERSKGSEKAFKLLLDLRDVQRPWRSLAQEVLPGGQRLALGATPCQLYVWAGGPKLEHLFGGRQEALLPLMEVETPSLHSQIQLWRPAGDPSALPSRLAWLAGATICYGELKLPSSSSSSSSGAGGDALQGVEYISYMKRLMLPESREEAVAMALSQYHYLLLYPAKLQLVNSVSGRVVQEVQLAGQYAAEALAPAAAAAAAAAGAPLSLVRDDSSGQSYLVCGDAVLEVCLSREDRDMWKVYLEHGEFESALKLCTSSAQRDSVHLARAEPAFEERDYATAAVAWGKVAGGRPAFEDLALRLVEAGDAAALEIFLTTKLQVLGRSDRAQSTMVASWLTELQLDSINRALLEAGGEHSQAYQRQADKLRKFLEQHVEVLDPATTAALLSTYGRVEDLMAFAAVRGDHEALLELLLARPGGAAQALAVLRQPAASVELAYKFAPALVAQAPAETVDFWMLAQPPLDPRRLLPALVRFGEPAAPAAARRHVLRYVRFAMQELHSEDVSLHNLALSLLSLDADDAALLELLLTARSALGTPLYDAKYALRLCKERCRPRACVTLLCELQLYEAAAALALAGGDLELAKAVAAKPEDDEGLRRKLWLSIAKEVVQGGAAAEQQQEAGGTAAAEDGAQAVHIKQAVELLKEAGGLLRIEDILPFFPDFVTIDNFRDAICESLQRYTRHIESLEREMDEATEIAEALRRDLRSAQRRVAVVSYEEPCARCGRQLGQPPPNPSRLPSGGAVPPLYVFPSGLAFHGLCCAAEVIALVSPQQQTRIKTLLDALSKLPPANGGGDGGGGGSNVESLLAQLEEQIASECPWNGEVTVRLIDMPFVSAERDRRELEGWAI